MGLLKVETLKKKKKVETLKLNLSCLPHPSCVTDNSNAFVSSKTLSKHKLLLLTCASPNSTQPVPTQRRKAGRDNPEITGVSLERPVNTR